MDGERRFFLNGRQRQQCADEIVDEIAFEEDEVKKGRIDNAVLLEGLAGEINIRQFLNVARYRGTSWKFLSALSDKSLQLQGYALLDFIADALALI